MNTMPMVSPAITALITAVMMVAMMLPSLAAALWCYHRDLRTMRVSHAGERTMLFAAGYAGVWMAVGLLLFAMHARPYSEAPANAAFASLGASAIVLCAGALQRSRWKARQLARCRQSRVPALGSTRVGTAWRDGCRLAVDCTLSCAAPMAVLLVAGLMESRMMLVVTAAITAERVLPSGARIARLTGTIALIAGSIMSLRAISNGGFLLAIDASAMAAPRAYASALTDTRGTQSEHRPAVCLHRRATP